MNYPERFDRRTVEVFAVPQLEHQQLPEPQRVVAAAGEVLAHDAIDERRLEIAALARARALQRVEHEVREADGGTRCRSARRSRCFGRAKTSAGRIDAAACFSTRLRSPPSIFIDAGSDAANDDDLVIEQRHARLDRVRHAHAIDLVRMSSGR